MAQDIGLELDVRAFAASLRLTGQQVERAMAKALQRTAFEVIEEERKHAQSVFADASQRGRDFLGGKGSFRFVTSPDRMTIEVTPSPNAQGKRGTLLAEHERGGVLLPSGRRLGLGDDALAIPIGEASAARQRSPRGKLPVRLTPAKLLERKGRGFLAMRGDRGVLLQRRGRKKSSRVVALFAIVPKAKLEATFRYYAVAREAAARWFPVKVREEFGKIRAK